MIGPFEKYDVESFIKGDFIGRHPVKEVDFIGHIFPHIQWLLETKVYDKNNAFVIADIGCGDGKFAPKLIRKIPTDNCQLFLIDPYGNENNQIFRMSDKTFGHAFPSNFVDIIISKDCSHFFGDDLEQFQVFLDGCQRILKPGGMLAITNLTNYTDFPWGDICEKKFRTFANCGVFLWRDKKPKLKNCNVQHFKVNEHTESFFKEKWFNFIHCKAWTNLQLLTDAEFAEVERVVQEKYANDTHVELNLRWWVSTVIKKGNSISSKL